jgi:DNA gyrase subunit B
MNWSLQGNQTSVKTHRFGQVFETFVGPDLLMAPEWIELSTLWNQISEFSRLPVVAEVDGHEKSFSSYAHFYEQVMEASKKGYYIQRYKGLGEMNPEQLWETTLNPQVRSLLKVSIDDALAADETFSILMGEQVEPRRKFIHDNALMVRSLDV